MDFQLNLEGGQKLEAPHKTRNNSIRYKVVRYIGVKSNQFTEYHPDARDLFARNKQIWELAELFSEMTNLFSVDGIAKVKVGVPAVSRYHQLLRLYATNDMPNFTDHDFPIPGYFINVSGYMRLGNLDTVLNKSNETETNSVDVTLPDEMYVDTCK